MSRPDFSWTVDSLEFTVDSSSPLWTADGGIQSDGAIVFLPLMGTVIPGIGVRVYNQPAVTQSKIVIP